MTRPPSPELLHRYLQVAVDLAHQAGEVMLAKAGTANLQIDTKSNPYDLVTEVDRTCDTLIRSGLQQAFPQDTLLTEETWQDGQDVSMPGTWVVDPVDGTTNFAHGFPHFAVSIAYVWQGDPVLGVVFDPCRDELFTAIRHQGALRNNRPIATSTVAQLNKALLATGFPYDHTIHPRDNFRHFMTFMELSQGVRRPGSAALDLAYVACGRLDGLWEMRLAPWDVAAGALLIQEAGGTITQLLGQPLKLNQRKIDLLAANSTGLHQDMLAVCLRLANDAPAAEMAVPHGRMELT